MLEQQQMNLPRLSLRGSGLQGEESQSPTSARLERQVSGSRGPSKSKDSTSSLTSSRLTTKLAVSFAAQASVEDPDDPTPFKLTDVFLTSRELGISHADLRLLKELFCSVQPDQNLDACLTETQFMQIIEGVCAGDPQDLALGMSCEDGSSLQFRFKDVLQWYSVNGFREEMLLNGQQRDLRDYARHLGVPPDLVDKAKMIFDRHQDKQSGTIAFDQFCVIVDQLLGVPKHLEFPRSRLTYFWSQADSDKSGTIDFNEFLTWWLETFGCRIGYQWADVSKEFYMKVRPVPIRAEDEDAPKTPSPRRLITEKKEAGRMPKINSGAVGG